jgi:hypothetical protein
MGFLVKVTKLREIRGIGPSVEEKLISYFGSEQQVLNVIRGSRIADISSIDGIGERFALGICRNLHFQETGEQLDDFLKTEDTVRIYNKIIDIISNFGNTFYSRSKILLNFPLPISSIEKIKNKQKSAKMGQDVYKLIHQSSPGLESFDFYLKQLTPLKEPKEAIDTTGRAILTTESRISTSIQESVVGSHCEIIIIEDMNSIKELVKEFDELLWIGNDFFVDEDLPNLISIEESHSKNIDHLIPELTLSFFAQNKNTLNAIIKLAILLKQFSKETIHRTIGSIDVNSLIEMENHLKFLNDTGEPDNAYNSEYNRLLKIDNKLDIILGEVLVELNDNLEKMIQQTTIQLGGEKILSMLKDLSTDEEIYVSPTGSSDFRDYLDDELFLSFEEQVNSAEANLNDRLGLNDEESGNLKGIFPHELKFPIYIQEDVKQGFSDFLRKKIRVLAFGLKVKLAKELSKQKQLVFNSLSTMLELDYLLMLGKFSHQYNLILPTVTDNNTGVYFKNGTNLFLMQQELEGLLEVEKVSYAIGEIGKTSENVKGERIVLLSGANSGGKTTLLVAIVIIVILSQMGLPVPSSSALIGGFNELHYYRKSTGYMNAGAFESTLRTLSSMIMSKNSRLVLADEMESISEPGASARVIAAFLDLLGRSERSVGVFVTHLAQEIKKHCKEGVRIDGIEAKGLAEDLSLIVDRTPKYYTFAKSTPELIVQRLQKVSKGTEKEIYSYILDIFNQKSIDKEN